MSTIDPERAFLHGADDYPRLRVGDDGVAMPDKLAGDRDLLVIERGGGRLAFTLESMAWHHVAQGELHGEPWVLAFCVICHSGMGHDPRIDGVVHHFSAGGLYNGLMLMIDDETGSYWNHVTGECVHGPLAGRRLETFNVELTTVASARKQWPELRMAKPQDSRFWLKRLLQDALSRRQFRKDKGVLPPHFPKTFEEPDERREAMEHGLGVVGEHTARYYPMQVIKRGRIVDTLDGRPLSVWLDENDHLPRAEWREGGAPRQLFTRWYGFSMTYRGCDIYGT